MSSTATRLKNDTGVELFYYLKITGLPYYFFSVINPTSSTYGSAAWTLPAGYTAVQGMELPDDDLTQSIGDIVGGICEAENTRVSLRDFQVSTTSGSVFFLSRLFAPGRQASTGVVAELETPIHSTDDDTTITFRNVPAAGLATTTIGGVAGHVHIGGECIRLTSISSVTGGRCTASLDIRNRFPCATGYPPVPYHRVLGAQANVASDPPADIGLAGTNPRVTSEPATIIGRSAALYIGHMTPDGKPCTEAEAMCRLIGRITAMDYGKGAGRYTLQIDSILADLDKAAVAGGLASVTMKRGQIILSSATWRTLVIEKKQEDSSDNYVSVISKSFVIDDGGGNVYTSFQELVNQVNKTLQTVIGSSGAWSDGLAPVLGYQMVNGERRAVFTMVGVRISNLKTTYRISNPKIFNQATHEGLLTVLGFTSYEYEAPVPPGSDITTAFAPVLTAETRIPDVFFVHGSDSSPVSVTLDRDPSSLASEIFTDQGDGAAYVRLDNGSIMTVVGTDLLNNQVDLGKQVYPGSLVPPRFRNSVKLDNYYYAPEGQTARIDQVLVFPGDASPLGGALDLGLIIGRILASNPAGTVDATFNTLAEGAGLGWIDILDTASFSKLTTEAVQRVFVIDSTTKFADLFAVLAKEYGWMLCWDPEQAKVSARKVFVPSAPVAHAISFSESNRVQTNDRTSARVDQSNLRTSWMLKWGWNRTEGKFMGPDVTINDRFVASSYGIVSAKAEKLEDKSLVLGGENSAMTVLGELIRRSYFYRQPWLVCKRSLNKSGLLLAPGTVHQIIDSTIVNPFTGAVGVTSADRIYGMLMSVTSNLSTGECEVTFSINQQDPGGLFRWFSPVGLVDFAASSHGYNTTTGVLTMASRYASDGTSKDGIDFAVGDTVHLVPWDSPDDFESSTVTAVASDGSTVTIASGLTALTVETLLVLQGYATATTARKQSVAFQGSYTGVIDSTTDQNHRWL